MGAGPVVLSCSFQHWGTQVHNRVQAGKDGINTGDLHVGECDVSALSPGNQLCIPDSIHHFLREGFRGGNGS